MVSRCQLTSSDIPSVRMSIAFLQKFGYIKKSILLLPLFSLSPSSSNITSFRMLSLQMALGAAFAKESHFGCCSDSPQKKKIAFSPPHTMVCILNFAIQNPRSTYIPNATLLKLTKGPQELVCLLILIPEKCLIQQESRNLTQTLVC